MCTHVLVNAVDATLGRDPLRCVQERVSRLHAVNMLYDHLRLTTLKNKVVSKPIDTMLACLLCIYCAAYL